MLSLVNLITIIYIILLFRKKYPISLSMYWIVIFYAIYVFVPYIRHQTSILSGISDSLVSSIAAYSLVGLLSFILTNSLFLFKWSRLERVNLIKQTEISHINVKKLLTLFVIVSLILLVLSVGITGILSVFQSGSRNLWLHQTNDTILATFAELSSFYVGVLASVLVLSASKNIDKKKSIIIFIFILLSASILVFARRHVIYPLFAVIFYKLSKTVNKLKIFIVGICAFPLFFISMFFMGYFRTFGLHEFNVASVLSYLKNGKFMDIFISNTDFAASYKYLAAQINHEDIFVGPLGYFKLLFTFIPRSIWSDKPQYISVEVLSKLEPLKVSEGFSAASGYIGEAHAALGIGGIVIISSIWGLLCGILDKKYHYILNRRKNIQVLGGKPFGFTLFEFYYLYTAMLLITESHRGDFGAASIHFVLEIVLIGLIIKFSSKRLTLKNEISNHRTIYSK
ncbi:O-antigen polysaccharide polymerase Wzy [Bacillus infantis]|uniref:O-antigen polysaccharide polymerase Wzy n=1 Tax=Bacillus infantis TaxID=324767 RepID=A0A5D4SNQ0_9BACI|nr:O-antigen polysaccharide polymerase Wzy [Bacillus infantis]TYS63954.1 O-antigen polysaccharide polymerase Wzy [Bacillus infantis]